MMNKWELIHDEELAPSRTMSMYLARYDNGEPRVLWEVGIDGLRIRYYSSAQDAVADKMPLADICYGENSLLWEEHKQDELMDKIHEHIPYPSPLYCEHEGQSCDERFHQAQVELGNEKRDHCASCRAMSPDCDCDECVKEGGS